MQAVDVGVGAGQGGLAVAGHLHAAGSHSHPVPSLAHPQSPRTETHYRSPYCWNVASLCSIEPAIAGERDTGILRIQRLFLEHTLYEILQARIYK